MLKHEEEQNTETRFDAQAIQKMVALASRLEQAHQETMTTGEVEQIGADVGLDPVFVREALAQLAAQEATATSVEQRRARSYTRSTDTGVLRSKEEFLAWLTAFNIPILHSILAFFFGRPASHGGVTAAELFAYLVLPLLLSWVPGFLTARKRAGVLFGLWYATCLMFTTFLVYPNSAGGEIFSWPNIVSWLQYAVPGTLLGAAGAWLRARISPPKWLKGSNTAALGRQALLDQFFALQKELESHKQHRAFLSIDVVGSSQMKQAAPELAVEHSFNAYLQWIEEAVHAAGGELQSAAGDGVMCIFRNDRDAVRAARQLQEGIASFNTTHNRLPLPFRIRCGVSAGTVALVEGMPIGSLQSPVIDRAAYLQKHALPDAIELDDVVSE